MDDLPKGQRFSHIYQRREELTNDSPRLRKRIASFYASELANEYSTREQIVNSIHSEIGVDIPFNRMNYPLVGELIISCSITDFLDIITIITRSIRYHRNSNNWLKFVTRAFSEENVCYTLDEEGGVHFHIDQEFEVNRVSALHALDKGRLSAASNAFNTAFAALDEIPADAKTAARDIFEAVEVAMKQIDSRAKRLSDDEIEKYLKPFCRCRYPPGSTEAAATGAFLDTMKKWVGAIHQYRHGQEEPSPPPIELAIAFLSTGASYLRFLAEIADKPAIDE